MEATESQGLFSIDQGAWGPISLPLVQLAHTGLRRLLGLETLESAYHRLQDIDTPAAFLRGALAELKVGTLVRPHDLERIPRQGPTLVVANHPYGGLEGIVLLKHLLDIRPDVRVMANYLLGRLPQLRELFIFVDPFEANRPARANLGPLRRCLTWVKRGGLLVVFPAGEVSHLRLGKIGVNDPPWNEVASYIAEKAQARVCPVFFDGRNSALFQLAGLLHPRLRTLLLPRELANKAGEAVSLVVGSPLPPQRLALPGGHLQSTALLRLRTHLLKAALRPGRSGLIRRRRSVPAIPALEAVAPAEDASLLQREVESLPPEQVLLFSGDYAVLYAFRRQAPGLVREIGRAREISFRQAQEGSGRARDLDRHDDHYVHLCLWNRKQRELAGGYRLGPVEQIISDHGLDGLYATSLFRLAPGFFDRLPGALELGRSFIAPSYQRSYSALLLLWKGIGLYVMAHPHLRHLFGLVSLSQGYGAFSRRLLAEFLRRNHRSELSGLVTPLNPPRFPRGQGGLLRQALAGLSDLDQVSQVIADLEPDGKGAPILFKQYLKLGALCCGVNRDPAFGNVLDCLLVADLLQADFKTLARYCGAENLERYRAQHPAMGSIAGEEAPRRVA